MKLRWSFRAANDRAPQSESQVPSLAPNRKNPNQNFPAGKEFEFFCLLGNMIVNKKTFINF